RRCAEAPGVSGLCTLDVGARPGIFCTQAARDLRRGAYPARRRDGTRCHLKQRLAFGLLPTGTSRDSQHCAELPQNQSGMIGATRVFLRSSEEEFMPLELVPTAAGPDVLPNPMPPPDPQPPEPDLTPEPAPV